MSDVHTHIEQYAGDNALYCYNGMHSYTNGICAWCDRRERHWLSDHAPGEAAPRSYSRDNASAHHTKPKQKPSEAPPRNAATAHHTRS